MKKFKQNLSTFVKNRMGKDVQIHIKLFNFSCISGVICSIVAFICELFIQVPLEAIICCGVSCLLIIVMAILGFVTKKNTNHLANFICICINFILFPLEFWATGGIYGGMAFYFILGVFLCAILLVGKSRYFITISAIIFDIVLTIVTSNNPSLVLQLTPQALQNSIISSFLIVSLFISVVSYFISFQYQKSHEKITELNELLAEQAIKDDLCKIYNRRHIISRLEDMANNYKKDQSVFLEMFDLDDFKYVNDNFGHIIGNEMLKKFSMILLDETNNIGVVGRYGGEEFLVLLNNCDEKTADKVAEKVRSRCEIELVLPDKKALTVSVGLLKYDPHWQVDKYISYLDEKMYAAKAKGKNQVSK